MTNIETLNQTLNPLILQFLPWFILLIVWSLIWKGLALWKAAQLKHKAWFIVILLVNTVGILEILYLWVFSKKQKGNLPS